MKGMSSRSAQPNPPAQPPNPVAPPGQAPPPAISHVAGCATGSAAQPTMQPAVAQASTFIAPAVKAPAPALLTTPQSPLDLQAQAPPSVPFKKAPPPPPAHLAPAPPHHSQGSQGGEGGAGGGASDGQPVQSTPPHLSQVGARGASGAGGAQSVQLPGQQASQGMPGASTLASPSDPLASARRRVPKLPAVPKAEPEPAGPRIPKRPPF
jgi:hypothetical protein